MWSLLKIQRPVATLTDKCLVLDIDETLVHTFDDGERINKNMIWNDPNLLELRRRIYEIELIDIAGIRGKGDYYKMSGIMRPYLKEFLSFCFNYFKVVAIWSAGKYEYVHAIVNQIFKDLPYPDAVYTRDDCELIDGSYVKPLSKMIDREKHLNMSLNNTIILDDKNYTFYPNPQNGILIPGYYPSGASLDKLMIEDVALYQFIAWLNKYLSQFSEAKDLRNLRMNAIFITPLDELINDSYDDTSYNTNSDMRYMSYSPVRSTRNITYTPILIAT